MSKLLHFLPKPKPSVHTAASDARDGFTFSKWVDMNNLESCNVTTVVKLSRKACFRLCAEISISLIAFIDSRNWVGVSCAKAVGQSR